MKISLIVPCFNEEANVGPFFNLTSDVFTGLDYEIIFVNDGSRDQTLSELRKLYQEHSDCISVISFSRNFGKEAAVLAGLQKAAGDYISIIDADLQQNPKLILEMIDLLENHPEYDSVAAYQEKRMEGKIMSGVKKMFYRIMNKVCDIEFYAGASDFRTFRKSVVDAVISMPEYFRFSKGLFSWVGFETFYMPYVADERNSGESKWSVTQLIKYAIEGFISFTTFPLKIATYLGAFMSVLSLIFIIEIFIEKIFFSIDVPGYPTIIVLILLIGGIQLLILGIIGEYLARIYIQGKNRPVYITKEYLEHK